MFTPQQIEQISFKKTAFNGYDTRSVDELLEPLTEDYITLYKENALLKSKMRVLVAKLEEYRKNEASMKDAIVNAQKTCDMMVKEAESKCALMLNEANLAAAENSKNAAAVIAEENARVDEARMYAAARIDDLEAQLRSCIAALEQIKASNRPSGKATRPEAFDAEGDAKTAAVADEISENLEALMGKMEGEEAPITPKHPVSDSTTKFTDLKFGRNYDSRRK